MSYNVLIIFPCAAEEPEVVEKLLQSDEEPGVDVHEQEVQSDQHKENLASVDQSCLQSEMRSFSICSTLDEESPAANSTFHTACR